MFGNERSMSGLKAQQSIAQGNALGRQTAASAPCKGKSIRNQAIMKDTFALTGRIHNMPVTSPQGGCPGLWSVAPSGRAQYAHYQLYGTCET